MTKEERLEKARAIRSKGYNCAQTVAMAFSDVTGMDEETTARATAGFGGGIGGLQEVCGVVSALAFAAGMLGDPSPNAKAGTYRKVRELVGCFKDTHGRILCRELKGGDNPVPCDELIMSGIGILHDTYCKDEA